MKSQTETTVGKKGKKKSTSLQRSDKTSRSRGRRQKEVDYIVIVYSGLIERQDTWNLTTSRLNF